MSKLLDSKGKPVQTRNVPVVKYKEFMFPVDFIREDERVDVTAKRVNPLMVIKELRATQRELNQRFSILAAALSVLTEKNPELKEFLDTLGLQIIDANEKVFYGPKKAV